MGGLPTLAMVAAFWMLWRRPRWDWPAAMAATAVVASSLVMLFQLRGAYVGALMEDDGQSLGIVNVNALDLRDTFDPAPPLHVYDGENAEKRRARRRKFWMKATLIA